jgi:hypothetical protein
MEAPTQAPLSEWIAAMSEYPSDTDCLELLKGERELFVIALLIEAAPFTDIARERLGTAVAAISKVLTIVRRHYSLPAKVAA